MNIEMLEGNKANIYIGDFEFKNLLMSARAYCRSEKISIDKQKQFLKTFENEAKRLKIQKTTYLKEQFDDWHSFIINHSTDNQNIIYA